MESNTFTLSEKVSMKMPQKQDQALSETQVIEIARHAVKSELTAAAIYMRLAEKFRDDDVTYNYISHVYRWSEA